MMNSFLNFSRKPSTFLWAEIHRHCDARQKGGWKILKREIFKSPCTPSGQQASRWPALKVKVTWTPARARRSVLRSSCKQASTPAPARRWAGTLWTDWWADPLLGHLFCSMLRSSKLGSNWIFLVFRLQYIPVPVLANSQQNMRLKSFEYGNSMIVVCTFKHLNHSSWTIHSMKHTLD